MATAPHLVQLHDKLQAQGLVILGVTEEPVPSAMQFASKVAWDGKIPIAVDERASLRQIYSVGVYPTQVLIGRRGIVRWRGEGASAATLEAEITKLLSESGN